MPHSTSFVRLRSKPMLANGCRSILKVTLQIENKLHNDPFSKDHNPNRKDGFEFVCACRCVRTTDMGVHSWKRECVCIKRCGRVCVRTSMGTYVMKRDIILQLICSYNVLFRKSITHTCTRVGAYVYMRG